MIYNRRAANCNRQLSMQAGGIKPLSGARSALFLLLAINLFNYIDRQILAALEPDIRATFFAADDVHAMTKTGLLGDAFFVTYMISAPILGFLADRFSRWIIVGSAVILWSLASGASGLAATFGILFATRIFVGIGEGGYGPAAPTILSDLFPIETRGRIMAIFCSAIPVGSALGYVIGGLIGAHFGWRWAFYLVAPPGLLLGLLCFWQRDPRVAAERLAQKSPRRSVRDYLNLFRTRSYLINCIAMTLMTFVTGGLGFWVPAYLRYRDQSPAVGMTIFGLITVVAGLVSTLLGGVIADKLRSRLPGSYFWVSGIGMLIACPFFVVALYIPFPAAWIPMFLAIFCLVFKHRSVKHGSRERFAAGRARDSVCRKHFRHPCVRGCSGVLAAGLHWRSREHACGVFVCVRNYSRVGGHMAFGREISPSRYGRRRRQNDIAALWGAKKARRSDVPG